MAPRRPDPRLARLLPAFGVILPFALLLSAALAADGRIGAVAVIGAAAASFGAASLLVPRGPLFAFGLGMGLVLYATVFSVLATAQFPQAGEWARVVAFLLPLAAFLGTIWARRAEVARIAEARSESAELAALPARLRWLVAAAAVGLLCFLLPLNRAEPWVQSLALPAAMGAIGGIVALAFRDVVGLAVDVALLMEEVAARGAHLVVPAAVFVLVYALLVIGFGSAYRIADALSAGPLFAGPHGPLRLSFSDAMHFSIVTLSTVGYGDIQPADDGIRVLASLQVVSGLLLLLFGVAELLRGRNGTRG
ncbi:MAG: ion channel [Acetobacteraceae bacterium]|nr:ion channel [Acetobacteraceae bacterium]